MTESSTSLSDEIDLSVVIPTFKETDRIGKSLESVCEYLEGNFPHYEVLIVDDPDDRGGYTQISDRFASNPRIVFIKQKKRLGKGAAVKTGVLAARGKFVLFMDADSSTPIEEFNLFVPYLRNSCIIAGVRTYQENESKWRRVVGLLAQLFLHVVLFKRAVVDSQCGFKAFSRDVAKALFPLLKTKGGMIDAEIFYLAHKFNIPTVFVAVHWKNDPNSRINVLRCIIRDPIDILLVLLRDRFTVYGRGPILSRPDRTERAVTT